jgi:Holliday junction resolvasome RuvABC endonuclease subunit
MLTMPEGGDDWFNICSIDPGTMSLGFGVITVGVGALDIRSSTAKTYKADKMIPKEAWVSETFGERFARLAALEEALLIDFCLYQPLMIVAESPFFNPGRPMAYGALIETLAVIRSAVRRYDVWRQLYLVDPPSVKNAVGARGDGSKDAVKKRILAMTELNYCGPTPLNELDEHSIDALAVGYARLQAIRELSCPPF